MVVNATGFRPNLTMLREIRLSLDDIVEAPANLAPLIDPNLHSCGNVPPHGGAELTHPEPNFYIARMKSYGRAPPSCSQPDTNKCAPSRTNWPETGRRPE